MIVGIDEGGTPITKETVDEIIHCVENEDFSEFEDASDCVYGQITPLSQEKTTISFTIPVSVENDLSNLAKKQNCTRSDILRSFVYDGLLRTSI